MDKREGPQLEDMKIIENSITQLKANLEAMDQRMADTRGKMHTLREVAEKEGVSANIRSLLSLLESLKALEKQEAEIESSCSKKCSELQSELSELDEMILSHDDGENFAKRINESLVSAVEKLNSVKMELASKLREIVSLKRRRDDVPTQAELIQYELRFSELNIHIQRKLQQTRKFYATYNALLEIKELMLKETSLLNSISSQFQDAFSSPAGRATLTSSMDGIEKSIQQKLQNVQITLQAEQRACEALREKHTAANSEKRRCYSLLKAFQEECAKNERLRSQTSEIHI